MASAESERSLFYEEDLVVLADDTKQRVAVVIQTWHEDSEDDEEEVEFAEHQYMIEWQSYKRQIVAGKDLLLIDRAFQVGDICKKRAQSTSEPSSGIVTNIKMEAALQQVATMASASASASASPCWMTTTSLCRAACIEEGDHVIYRNWVGVVELVFEEALIKVRGNNRPYKVFCVEGGLHFGSPSDSQLDTMHGLVTGKNLPRHITPANSKVIAIRQSVVFVAWLAVNQKLSPNEEDTFPEPKAIWTNLEELIVIRPFDGHKYTLGDDVFVTSQHMIEGNGVQVTCFDDDKVQRICETRTEVEVTWQDGSCTWQSSTNLDQPDSIEDHQVWPGDHLVYRDEDSKEMAAVVQSMNSIEQTVCLIAYGNQDKEVKTVSVLDCKLEGSPDYPHGINRGDIVLLSGSNTGYTAPCVSRLGKAKDKGLDEEEIVHELIEIGQAIARQSSRGHLSIQKRPRLGRKASEIDWYGAVVDCNPSGDITIELPDGNRIEERVERLNYLIDELDDEDEVASSNGSDWESATDDEQGDLDHIQLECNIDGLDIEPKRQEMPRETKSVSSITAFKILEHAPSDHAFFNFTHNIHSQRNFLSRVQHEHKVLSSSLPDTILVRTYEDRLDLIRTIIIGSQGTPYEDAPICIDFHLKSSFPCDPPLAYFHSWSQGLGKINPHLYEDGSVCLSLLNTWQGDKIEAWNPVKSTLLQILISIQGLVLITEPGLEAEQSLVNQQSTMLYWEKAYILSRHFIVHALQTGVKGFESDLQQIYETQGRCSSSIRKAKSVLDGDKPACTEVFPHHLTKGGVIALRRVIKEMERLRFLRIGNEP